MFKVNNKDTRTTPSVSVVNFEQLNTGCVVPCQTPKKFIMDVQQVLKYTSQLAAKYYSFSEIVVPQQTFTCSKSAKETLEKDVIYVQS